jgi:SAM-dependent methyltransferase
MRPSPPPPSDRNAKLRSRLKIASGKGLEFGPLSKPLVLKSEGDIRYVDAKSIGELRRWLPSSGSYKGEDYVEIDYVWDGGDFRKVVGPDIAFDYAIGSHVIEQVPNMIGWVNDIVSVLADDGILSLAIPNKRYSLDIQRQETGCAQVIDDWMRGLGQPSAAHVFDHYSGVARVERDEYLALWRGDIDPSTIPRYHSDAEALDLATKAHASGQYTNCQTYVFTPQSFLRMCGTLIGLGIWRLRILEFYDTEQGGQEFIALLQKPPAGESNVAIRAEGRVRAAALINELHSPDAKPDAKPDVEELIRLRAETLHLRAEIAALRSSSSWRITAPLRSARLLLFGRRDAAQVPAPQTAVQPSMSTVAPAPGVVVSEPPVAAAVATFRFEGYDIPVELINLTGAGPDSFGQIAEGHISHLKASVGLDPHHKIVEIGCGIGRDAIQLEKILAPDGRYTGIDIIKRSIDWCQANIARKHPNFSFVHYDIKDQLHNPGGEETTTNIHLPFADGSIDRIILWSVFTHMFRDDIVHYLREFRRTLAPNGLVFASCFIVDDAVIESARRTNLTPYDLRFEHLYEPGCYINNLEQPAGAVAFLDPVLRSMIAEAGLRLVRPFQRGSWSGYFSDPDGGGQDAMILARE